MTTGSSLTSAIMNDLPKNYTFYLKILLIAAVYGLLAIASLPLSFDSSNATPVWPASGFAFAVLLLWKPGMAPGIFLGAFSANLYVLLNNQEVSTFTAVWVSLVIGIGNTLEALSGYWLLNRLIPETRTSSLFKNIRSVYSFVIAALAMCLTSCTIGATAIVSSGIADVSLFMTIWFTWWTGDVSGILIITPFIIAWSYQSANWMRSTDRVKILETVLLVFAIAITSGIVFEYFFPSNFVLTQPFMVIPFVIWAAIRLDLKLVTLLLLVSAGVAIAGTLKGSGPLIGPTLNESLLTVESFVSINSIMALMLHAAITERREKEISLYNARNELEQLVAERTRELHERNQQLQKRNSELVLFSYAVSHDLQEPIRKIEFFSGRVLEDENALSPKGKDFLQRIRTSSQKMKQLIENLLSYSIVEGNKKNLEKTDLNQVVSQVQQDLSEQIQQTGALIQSDQLPGINGVPSQLHELFTNLMTNSIKFRKQDERLEINIACEMVNGADLAHLGATSTDDYYHISFTDNGIGFEQQYASTIIDILQRLHGQNEYAGTGIGLAICKKVVENHQGFIAAEGEPGGGCSIHIYLPVEKNHSADYSMRRDRGEQVL